MSVRRFRLAATADRTAAMTRSTSSSLRSGWIGRLSTSSVSRSETGRCRPSKCLERRVLVEREAVEQAGADALPSRRDAHAVAVRRRGSCRGRRRSRSRAGSSDVATTSSSAGVVARRDRPPAREFAVEHVELGEQHRRLDRVEPAGEAEHHRRVAGALRGRASGSSGPARRGPRRSVRIAPPSP